MKDTIDLEAENARLRQAYDYILASRNNVDKELNEANERFENFKKAIFDEIHDMKRTCLHNPAYTVLNKLELSIGIIESNL